MANSADQGQLASKPTDLDLHCLLRQGMSCSARDRLIILDKFVESINRKRLIYCQFLAR